MRSMAQGLFCRVPRLVALAIVVGLSGCSDDTPSGPAAGKVVVVTESSAASTRSIGPAGGTIQATGSNGITYTLEIPPYALPRDTSITLTPVREIQGLPLSGGLVAAVDFKPSGLVFVNPATLTITTSARPTGSLKMVGLSYAGAGDSLGLALIEVGANEVSFTVTHFSGVGVGFGTTQDARALIAANPPPSSSSQFYKHNLAVARLQTPRDATTEIQVLEFWFDDVVLPALRNATTDAQLATAFHEWWAWNGAQLGLDSLTSSTPTLDARETQWLQQELGPKIGLAIAGNLQLCATQGTITSAKIAALDNALFWMTMGTVVGGGPAGSFPDRAAFASVSCARVVTVSVVPPPNPMQVGFPHSLDITFGLVFGSDPTPVPANFDVTVVASNATVGTSQGRTALSPAGFFTTVVTAQANPVFLAATGCYSTLINVGDELCHTEIIVGVSSDLDGRWVGSWESVSVPQISEEAALLVVDINQNQNAVSGPAQLHFSSLGHWGLLTATLSRNDLLGFEITRPAVCPGSLSGLGRVSPDLNTITATVSGSDCNSTYSNGAITLHRAGLPASCTIRVRNSAIIQTADDVALYQDVVSLDGANNGLSVGVGSGNLPQATVEFPCLGSTQGGLNVGAMLPGTTVRFPALSRTRDLRVEGSGIVAAEFPALTSVPGITPNGGSVTIIDNPDLTRIRIGAVSGASQLIIRGNPRLTSLNDISSGFTVNLFSFDSANNGFTRAHAIAFANRIRVTALVCETVNGTVQRCQDTPPWQ